MKQCFVAKRAVPVVQRQDCVFVCVCVCVCVRTRLLLWCCGSGNHACSMPGLSKNTSKSLMQFREL